MTLLSEQYADTIYKLVEDKEQLLEQIEQQKKIRKEEQQKFENLSKKNTQQIRV